MRFLLLTQYFPPEKGAAPTRMGAMAQSLLELGHSVEIVTAMPNYPDGVIASEYRGKFYVREDWNGCRVHRFWLYPATGKGFQRILNYLSFALIACLGVFRAKRPDWIFVNSGPLFMCLPAYLASRVWRRPYIFNVADLWPESIAKIGAIKEGPALRFLEKLELWAYKNAYAVTGVTMGIVENLSQVKKVPKDKILFLPNGVDTELFTPKTAEPKVIELFGLQDKTVFIYPGTHGYLHALEKVLDALKLIETKFKRDDIRVLFVGGGSEKPRLIEHAKALQLRSAIFAEPVSQEILADYISAADYGLIHQRNTSLANETRPAKALPMIAMAKPILYAGFGEGAELIKRELAGIVITPEDPELLAQTMLEFAARKSEYAAFGKKGRELALREFSWTTLVKAWLTQLQETKNRFKV